MVSTWKHPNGKGTLIHIFISGNSKSLQFTLDDAPERPDSTSKLNHKQSRRCQWLSVCQRGPGSQLIMSIKGTRKSENQKCFPQEPSRTMSRSDKAHDQPQRWNGDRVDGRWCGRHFKGELRRHSQGRGVACVTRRRWHRGPLSRNINMSPSLQTPSCGATVSAGWV